VLIWLLFAARQEAVKNCQYWRLRDPHNKPPGVIGYWPSRAVTFIDNHDTGAQRSPLSTPPPPSNPRILQPDAAGCAIAQSS
jgi:hypothetical protein